MDQEFSPTHELANTLTTLTSFHKIMGPWLFPLSRSCPSHDQHNSKYQTNHSDVNDMTLHEKVVSWMVWLYKKWTLAREGIRLHSYRLWVGGVGSVMRPGPTWESHVCVQLSSEKMGWVQFDMAWQTWTLWWLIRLNWNIMTWMYCYSIFTLFRVAKFSKKTIKIFGSFSKKSS